MDWYHTDGDAITSRIRGYLSRLERTGIGSCNIIVRVTFDSDSSLARPLAYIHAPHKIPISTHQNKPNPSPKTAPKHQQSCQPSSPTITAPLSPCCRTRLITLDPLLRSVDVRPMPRRFPAASQSA